MKSRGQGWISRWIYKTQINYFMKHELQGWTLMWIYKTQQNKFKTYKLGSRYKTSDWKLLSRLPLNQLGQCADMIPWCHKMSPRTFTLQTRRVLSGKSIISVLFKSVKINGKL